MTGFSSQQIHSLTRLGAACDGRKVLVRCGGPSGNYCCGGSHSAYYRIELSQDEGGGVFLVPVGGGHEADSRLDRDDYRYSHGGCVYQSAVDAAKELASALGL